MVYFGIYMAIVNVIAFWMYGADKRRARKQKWRVSEAALLRIAVIGGSIGALLGMKVFHHKTLKKKFSLGVPFILFVQCLLGAVYTYYHYY